MNIQSLGDLQTSFLGRRRNASLREQLTQLTQEIASGKRADANKTLGGNIAPLASIDRSLTLLNSYETATTQVDLRLSYAAAALESIQSKVIGLGPQILSADLSGQGSVSAILKSEAGAFKDAVSALQSRAGDQFVFSGENLSSPPLIAADEMLALLRTAVAGITDADNYYDTVDRWFYETGNGFETNGYLGGAAPTSDLQISSTSSVPDGLSAQDGAIRAVLRDFALITLIDEGSYAGDTSGLEALSKRLGTSLLNSDNELTALRADLGAQQEIVSRAIVQNSSERFAISEARNQLLNVDVFDSASRLEEVQIQLESLYLITAKTSRLNLAEYLR